MNKSRSPNTVFLLAGWKFTFRYIFVKCLFCYFSRLVMIIPPIDMNQVIVSDYMYQNPPKNRYIMYYRLISPLECIGKSIDSRDFQQNPRKYRSVELFESYKWVCWLSEKTNIRLSSAINIAKQYGWIIELIKEKLGNNENSIPLELFLVDNDPIKEIPMNDLAFFINNYNSIFEKTGVYIGDGDEPYAWEFIWEYVRQQVAPEMTSRLFSCFLFDNLLDTENFKKEKFNHSNIIVKIEIKEYRTICKFDMNWLSNVLVEATFSEAHVYASNYWQQKETEDPIWEFLCDCIYIPVELN